LLSHSIIITKVTQ